MPVNYQQLREQTKKLAEDAKKRSGEIQEQLEIARGLLHQCSEDPGPLTQRLQEALEANPELRCAFQVNEILDSHFPLPRWIPDWVILAADGSQINPSHHEAVEYGLTNVGLIRVCPGCGQAPTEETKTELLYGLDIQTAGGLITEDMIALIRDLKERELLVEKTQKEDKKVLAITDGMLEIFGVSQKIKEDKNYKKKFEEYQNKLRNLHTLSTAVAGYVDKPRSDLLVRLLELMLIKGPSEAGHTRPLLWITDAHLLSDLLAPGERSAIFGMHSSGSKLFIDDLALRFFYLNVGFPNKPWLARVEIPNWVAESEELTNQVHSGLLDQSRQMGKKPYPYVLHRAHEIAVVKIEEHEYVSNMIALELRNSNIDTGDESNKQFHKQNK